ncbi:P-type conjugative transfer protein TrbJ [Glycocaulis profundi]|nr:P-type conjugative transfer protein TrbJ [Glycocaulis profundi]
MKRMLLGLALALAPIGGVAPAASAQLFGGGIVYDPTNHAENVLQAARALQQIEHQIQQLTHEIRMLENMARDLESLPESLADDIRRRLARVDELMREAEGIGYRVEEIERAYEEAYPEDYGPEPPGADALAEDARERGRQSRAAWRDSLTLGAEIVSRAPDTAGSLDGMIIASQGAAGNLQAAQAGNQIAALQAQLLMQMEAMMAAHYRAEALDRARLLAEEARGRARTQSFLGR